MASGVQTTSGAKEDVSHVPGPAGGTGGAERPGRRRPGRGRRAAPIIAALAGVACLAAGCSSSPAGPAGKSSPGDAGAKALAYSKCMRSHGVPDFPDPAVNGNSVGISVHGSSGSDLNPGSPAYKAASRDCKSLAPPGLNGPQQLTPQQQAAAVKFAGCMRAHGYPSFPDPDGHGVFNLPGSINSNSAQFTSAANTCQKQTKLHSLAMNQRHGAPPPSSGS
jgi:hypothetical protein